MSETKKDGLGLDKEARLRLKHGEADGEAKPEPQLEPPFPYTVIPFPLNFFET